MAGALGVRLGGLNFYRGVPSHKAFLGDAVRPLDVKAFHRTRGLLYACALVAVALVCGVRRGW